MEEGFLDQESRKGLNRVIYEKFCKISNGTLKGDKVENVIYNSERIMEKYCNLAGINRYEHHIVADSWRLCTYFYLNSLDKRAQQERTSIENLSISPINDKSAKRILEKIFHKEE